MWPQVERMALDMLQRFARRKSVYHNPGLSVAVDEGGDDGRYRCAVALSGGVKNVRVVIGFA